MFSKNIVLVGFMGSGKTTISRQIAQHLGCPVCSLDDMIEQEEGASISRIFTEKGEAYFRQVEYRVAQKAAKEKGVVIDCGGGIVLNPDNITVLKKNGIVFFLDADERSVFERVKDQTHRPLLNVPDPLARIKELIGVRRPLYQRAADHIILTSGDQWKTACDQILKLAGVA